VLVAGKVRENHASSGVLFLFGKLADVLDGLF
jgi:hypothetical protein